MFSFIAGESPTDSSERCYYDDGLASFVFGLYDAIGPLKINLSKEREKNVWDYCNISIKSFIGFFINSLE